jgi:inorganic pyrophosphatase
LSELQVDKAFWEAIDQLVAASAVSIDRPKGSVHQRFSDIIYPLDYGYLDDTTSGDGQGIDVWIGSLPAKNVTAIICTIDLFKRDMEIKLLLGCTEHEIQIVTAFFTANSINHCLIRRTA